MWACPHSLVTKTLLAPKHATTWTPSACATNPGRWTLGQPGVKAQGLQMAQLSCLDVCQGHPAPRLPFKHHDQWDGISYLAGTTMVAALLRLQPASVVHFSCPFLFPLPHLVSASTQPHSFLQARLQGPPPSSLFAILFFSKSIKDCGKAEKT